MEMLLTNLSELGSNPFAWGVAALVVLKAGFTTAQTVFCPLAKGTANISAEASEVAQKTVFNPPLSFLFLVLFGMILAAGGLYMLADLTYGAIALGVIVVGMFLILTEPARLQVVGAQTGVIATAQMDGEAPVLARQSLKGAYVQRNIYELIIAVAVVAALWFI
ncbi:MAG: hypothetical protein AAF401_11265 [Pseudomonadota bacterium]